MLPDCAPPDNKWLQKAAGTEVSNFRLYGLDGWVSASTTLAEEGGQRYAVVALAVAESFPDGILEGVVAHWAVAGHDQKGTWESPPKGWISEPAHFDAAGASLLPFSPCDHLQLG